VLAVVDGHRATLVGRGGAAEPGPGFEQGDIQARFAQVDGRGDASQTPADDRDRPARERPGRHLTASAGFCERVTAAEPTPAPSMLVAPTSLARPETQEPSAPVVSNGKRDDEAELVRRARFALRRGDATTALALLAKVKSPRFTAQRDAAREDALMLQGDAGEP